MTRDEALRGAASFTVPAALVIGGSLATLAIIGGRGYQSEASPPRPAATVTVTAAPPVAVPSPEPSAGASRTLIAAGPVPDQATALDRPIAAQEAPTRRPQTPVPGGDSPIPSPTPGTGSTFCTGTVTAVHEPLGVLPGCAITIGGHP